ncbi:hypothetical protein AB0L41_23395 [Amycolatopsis mediterranei]|uniref:hypothetical protein n=1 Tax=Amycolatopsis mediterranei TaxID=33910 RepID=UPI003427B5BE
MSVGRGALLLAVLGASWLAGSLLGTGRVFLTSGYHLLVISLLAVGLYGSTRDIDIPELRQNRRTVVLALSVGVTAKVALISTVMVLFFPEPSSVVLGVAVAQIDPLAVAAAQHRSRMSASARAVLNAWAAFDDPVTVLLTVYLSMFALNAGGASAVTLASPVATFGLNILLNLGFAAVAFAAWLAARRLSAHGWLTSGRSRARLAQAGIAALVLLYAAFGVAGSLLLGIALIGLFFRPYPGWRRTSAGIVFGALLAATASLGVVLAGTSEILTWLTLVKGVVLGITAYAAQMLTGWFLSRGRDRFDRLYLTFSQQNGLTAIVLALVLEPDFPGAVAVIAPAIVVTNGLYYLGGALVRRAELRDEKEQEDALRPASRVRPSAAVSVPKVRRGPAPEPSLPRSDTAR